MTFPKDRADSDKLPERPADPPGSNEDAAWGSEIDGDQVTADIKAVRAANQELVEKVQRVQADFENEVKKDNRDAAAKVKREKEHLIEQLVPVLELLEGQLADLKTETPEPVYKGVELLYVQFLAALEQEGLQRGEPELQSLSDDTDIEQGPGVLADDLGSGIEGESRVRWKLNGRVLHLP